MKKVAKPGRQSRLPFLRRVVQQALKWNLFIPNVYAGGQDNNSFCRMTLVKGEGSANHAREEAPTQDR